MAALQSIQGWRAEAAELDRVSGWGELLRLSMCAAAAAARLQALSQMDRWLPPFISPLDRRP